LFCRIAKALAELHDGTLTVFSEGEGKGTTFTVSLPLVSLSSGVDTTGMESEVVIPMQTDNGASARQNFKILLVEDNKPTSTMMEKILTNKLGHSVITASSVREALDCAARHSFDVVLCDIGLPDGNGLELFTVLKSKYGLRGIALSGFGMEADKKQSFAVGFEYHLVKPVKLSELQETLCKMCN
jgi:CheY-like chemotaxis protein